MTVIDKHQPGAFCWAELSTTDAEAAKKFYTGLFGWHANDVPAGPDAVYTMLELEGKTVGALLQPSAQEGKNQVPPHWLLYVAVENADETGEKIQPLGGKVLIAPFDVMDVGRMAVLQDPAGATLALWQARAHIGAEVVDQPGALCWGELATSDKAIAGEFYRNLFGWQTKAEDTCYTEFVNGSCAIGGMMQLNEQWGDVPPYWMPYFAVADCDQSVRTAETLDAGIKVPPTDIPHVGRFSVIQDPQGAVFAIIKVDQH